MKARCECCAGVAVAAVIALGEPVALCRVCLADGIELGLIEVPS